MTSFSLLCVLVKKTSVPVFEQGHLSRTIFAGVNYLSSALVKENVSYLNEA